MKSIKYYIKGIKFNFNYINFNLKSIKFNFKSIKFRLWAGMMVLAAIVLILLWLFQIIFLGSFYTSMHISDIKHQISDILSESKRIDGQNISGQLDKVALDKNITIEQYTAEGKLVNLYGYEFNNGQMQVQKNEARKTAFLGALEGKETVIELIHPRFGNKYMVIGLPDSTADAVKSVIVLTIPVAPVEETVSILKKQLVYITVVLILASLAISFIISGSFTRPILSIQDVSRKMASGDFTARTSVKEKDEIGSLALSINHLGQQLSRMEELRKELVANVSHELRTPLSLIRGYAETLRDVTGKDAAKRDRQLGIIIEEAERLSVIVYDILNLSQLQSGYYNLEKRVFNLDELLSAVKSRYDILCEKTGIALQVSCASDIKVQADELRIGQVLYNLLNNAFNHTPDGGTIAVEVTERPEETGNTRNFECPGSVLVKITDTGRGIDEDEVAHIWERYFKSEKSSDKRAIGTGLGLAIVRALLEAHGASYGVKSIKGEGTTFWFELR